MNAPSLRRRYAQVVTLSIVAAFLLFATGCVTQDLPGEPPTTTAFQEESPPEDSNNAPPQTTTPPLITPSPTTTSPPTTSSLITPSPLEQCAKKENTSAADACYLALAIENINSSICNFISRPITKTLCLDNTQPEVDRRSTTIEGYVVQKNTNKGIQKITVKAYSKTVNQEMASVKTDSKGYYTMKVPSRHIYSLSAAVEGRTYNQEVRAKTNWTHEIWFKI
ncbi:MAG: hypothetical protein ABH950_04540 [Candidatus Altiarchaeota archaeon]